LVYLAQLLACYGKVAPNGQVWANPRIFRDSVPTADAEHHVRRLAQRFFQPHPTLADNVYRWPAIESNTRRVMKNLLSCLNKILFCVILLSVTGCQSPNLPTCESTTNPFPKPGGQPDDTQYNPNIEIGKVCSFTGEVERGQVYKQKIKAGLVFCLIPNSFWVENGGWTINIGDETGDECDFYKVRQGMTIPLVTCARLSVICKVDARFSNHSGSLEKGQHNEHHITQ
jgi:hypothetical protein